jgi:predicted nucleic acid-binding protein
VIAYFDTSALVKLVVPEVGSSTARAIWDGAARGITSRLTYAEARAALAAAWRLRRLTPDAHMDAKGMLEEWLDEMQVIDATSSVVHEAGDLAERYALRGYDAIHLASALGYGAPLTFATWDEDLAVAARTTGMEVAGISSF